MEQGTTAIIGAGPYGLSIAAHMKARGVPILIFGTPMDFWQRMPPGMHLKSSWSALNISDPAGKYSLNRYSKLFDIPWQEPVPLQLFLQYGHWFQQQVVPEVDQYHVTSLTHDKTGFHLDLTDRRHIQANRVVIATGIASFAHIPEFAAHLPSTLVSHSQDHSDFSRFNGQKVVVVGNGQSALESAALLYEAGADIELVARGPVLWINRKLYYHTGPARRIFYPPSDVGPPGVNWLVANPLLFRRFSEKARQALEERAIRPAGSTWLRSRVEGHVTITADTTITSASQQGQGVQLQLSDGTYREVDHVILGTGYRADIHSLTFIDPSLCDNIQTCQGAPILNDRFESSIPHLHFAGALAAYNFGPLCRFVTGAAVAARQIAKQASQPSTSLYSLARSSG